MRSNRGSSVPVSSSSRYSTSTRTDNLSTNIRNANKSTSAFYVICACAVLYTVSWISFVSSGKSMGKDDFGEPLNLATLEFLIIMIIASASVAGFIAFEKFTSKNRFEKSSLTMSFLFAGSFGLVLYGVIYTCIEQQNDEQRKWRPFWDDVGGVVSFFAAVLGLFPHLYGHYFYEV